MRIVVNDIAASAGGARTVLESLYRYVREFDSDNEWVFLLGSDLVAESDRIRTVLLPKVKRSWLRRLVFDLVSGRRLIRSLKPDILFSLQNTYTYGSGCPQVVYVHQSLPFQQEKTFSFLRRSEVRFAVYQHIIGALIKLSIRRADKVVVQTKWMREAILNQTSIAEDRIENILPDLEKLDEYRHEGEVNARSFFYPTSASSYKNNECIYGACRLLRSRGERDFMITMTIEPPPLEPEINPVGHVPRVEVLNSLARSTLIFPSYVETYGLPLAEAQALGAIVLAADLPYAREVLGKYENAYFFNPASSEELASLMLRVMSGSIVKAPMVMEGVPAIRHDISAWAKVIRVLEDVEQATGDIR